MFRLPKMAHTRAATPRKASRYRSPAVSSGNTSEQHKFLTRRDERGASHFRSDRYFTVAHEWFVTVRGGAILGPYPNSAEAKLAMAKHLASSLVSSPQATAMLNAGGDREATELEELARLVVECWEQRQSGSEISACAWIKQRLNALSQRPAELDGANMHVRLLNSLLDDLDGARI